MSDHSTLTEPKGISSLPPVLTLVDSLQEVDPADWDALSKGHPLLSHRFLRAFETSEAIGGETGWIPRYGLLKSGEDLIGAVPLYLKTHSYGEFVFDWSWARALEGAGLSYYPKLLSAIPFTPVTGPRLLTKTPDTKELLARAILSLPERLDVSSLHVLFPEKEDLDVMQNAGALIREGVQFHWQADGATDFEGFLSRLTSEKRKKIRHERKKVREAGIRCRIKVGPQIQESDWAFFYRCYCETYRQHRSTPYLSLKFFLTIAEVLSAHVMMVIADRDGEAIASALNFFDGTSLWGRHWGTLEFVPGLHFEVCYYQGIEFCLAMQLHTFEGGAQGEHKLARGFTPVATYSAHQLAHPGLSEAVEAFLERETQGVDAYINELEAHAPFKRSVGT